MRIENEAAKQAGIFVVSRVIVRFKEIKPVIMSHVNYRGIGLKDPVVRNWLAEAERFSNFSSCRADSLFCRKIAQFLPASGKRLCLECSYRTGGINHEGLKKIGQIIQDNPGMDWKKVFKPEIKRFGEEGERVLHYPLDFSQLKFGEELVASCEEKKVIPQSLPNSLLLEEFPFFASSKSPKKNHLGKWHILMSDGRDESFPKISFEKAVFLAAVMSFLTGDENLRLYCHDTKTVGKDFRNWKKWVAGINEEERELIAGEVWGLAQSAKSVSEKSLTISVSEPIQTVNPAPMSLSPESKIPVSFNEETGHAPLSDDIKTDQMVDFAPVFVGPESELPGSPSAHFNSTPISGEVYHALVDGERSEIGNGERIERQEAIKEFKKIAFGSSRAFLFFTKADGSVEPVKVDREDEDCSPVLNPDLIPDNTKTDASLPGSSGELPKEEDGEDEDGDEIIIVPPGAFDIPEGTEMIEPMSSSLSVADINSSGLQEKKKKATPRRPLTYFAIIDGKRQDIGSGNRMRKPEAIKEFEKVAVGSKKATLFAVKVSGDQKVREINNAVSQISQVVQKERRRPEYIPEKKGGHHDRRPRHELRFGKEVEKLNKISTGNALKAAQEKSKETGEAVEVWKYVVSKDEWSMVGVAELEEKRSGTVNSVPVKRDVSQNPGAEFIKSLDAFKQQGENSQFDITHLTNPSGGQSIGVRASGPGFDVLAAISLKIKETVSANGGEKKFYILEGPIGSIVGGYLTKEEAGRAESAVAELSRAFPGTIKLTQVDLTVPEQQALVNMMLSQAH